MEIGLARITVQNTFCGNCMTSIEKRIKEVHQIKNVYLHPKDSLVTFNFANANQISKVLNILTALGYPEQGDHMIKDHCIPPFCNCEKQNIELVKAS